ncbi:unnamed protein product [Peniophora sp. CBMAI 1063]|nr:unnamed protein product [Peniophora sp. CBMAI 1063]
MSDSDSDAPEAITLSQSARVARGREQALHDFAATEKRKAKEHNRVRDERLKAQAAGKKERKRPAAKRRKVEDTREGAGDSDQDDETRRLQARMERAMAEASDEDDGDSGEEDEFVDLAEDDSEEDDFGEEGSPEEGDADDLDDASSGDEDDASDDADDNLESTPSRNYLPDHIFAAAAAALPKGPQRSKPALSSESTLQTRKKRKRSARKTKDIVVGSHAVRTLPAVHRTSAKTSLSYTPAIGATTAPARINRFVSKSLALKGQKKRASQGWERKPVHLGLFKRAEGAPVTGFVRGQ